MSALPNGVDSAKARQGSSSHKPSAAMSSSTPDPASLLESATSPSDVRAALAALHEREHGLESRLDALMASHADLNRDLLRLDSLRAALGAQVVSTRSISNTMLASASDTAGRLSSNVRKLDLEKSRVEATLKVAEQVSELKACVAGVVGSMGAPQDWEAAAGYIARASRIPEEIVTGGFANAVVPTVEVPDPPSVTLEAARESLCSLFLREFEKAAKENDGARVTRFFKLFPLIGRGDVGLDVYGKYVCQGVAATARAVLKEGTSSLGQGAGKRDGFFYATALTKLFEHIAQIVEGHGGLVERHYGAGKMVRVIERLQMEADVQGGIILDTWSDERTVDRKLTDVKSYPFSFLVQSFLPQQRNLAGTPRVNSPALGGGTNNPRNSEDEGVNMKEVDGVLSEIAVMLGKWSLYSRFLAGKCRDPSFSEDMPLAVPDVLSKSNLRRKVLGRLIEPYSLMSTFFFRRSVEKAFQLDEFPTDLSLSLSKHIDSNPPYIISAVDDVMYIVNTVLQKSLSTAQRDVIASVLTTVDRVLGADFIGMIQRKMRDESYPKSVVQGGFPPEDKIVAFIVLINSLDMAGDYLTRIINGRLGVSTDAPNGNTQPSPFKDSFPFESDATFVASKLSALNATFSAKSNELWAEGIQVLFTNVVSKRLRPVQTDTFRDADYTLSEAQLADLAAQNDEDEEDFADQVPRRFEQGWDSLMKPLARIMTPKSYNTLLDTTAKYVAQRILEKRIWGYSGKVNAFGAIRMERDFNGIISTVAKGNYHVREAFAKTSQILMVANMEDDEWDELMADEESGDNGMHWVLSEDERRRARSLVRN